MFPIAHAERYAAALTDAELIAIPGAYSFTPEDQPQALATAIRRCLLPGSAPLPASPLR